MNDAKQIARDFVYNYIANAFEKSNFNGCESDYFKKFGHMHLAELVSEITNAYNDLLTIKSR